MQGSFCKPLTPLDSTASPLPMPNRDRPTWGQHVLLIPFVFFLVLAVMALARVLAPETPLVLQ